MVNSFKHFNFKQENVSNSYSFIYVEDSMDARPSPSSDSRTSTPEPKTTFKDKKEALEAFKDLLREKASF